MADQMHRAIADTTADTTATAIRAIWERNLPLIEERLVRLEAAAFAAEAGGLDDPQRIEANEIAHKLAGSLGMFGFPEGTEIARRLERIFNAERRTRAEVADLRGLVLRLRVVVLGAAKPEHPPILSRPGRPSV